MNQPNPPRYAPGDKIRVTLDAEVIEEIDLANGATILDLAYKGLDGETNNCTLPPAGAAVTVEQHVMSDDARLEQARKEIQRRSDVYAAMSKREESLVVAYLAYAHPDVFDEATAFAAAVVATEQTGGES